MFVSETVIDQKAKHRKIKRLQDTTPTSMMGKPIPESKLYKALK